MIIPDDIPPEGHDRLQTVEEWRRFNPPPKRKHWLRDRLRTFRFLRSPASETLLSGSEKAVRCPMPGLVVSIAVSEGQEVKVGETLAVVEAMKMENVLRAERDGVVKTIHAKVGDSLAVEAVIMEFA